MISSLVRVRLWVLIKMMTMMMYYWCQSTVTTTTTTTTTVAAAFIIPSTVPSFTATTLKATTAAVTSHDVFQSMKSSTSTSTSSSSSSTSSSVSLSRPYHLVIVESPSKCKTISKILEDYVQENDLPYDFIVESSMGHVRNLPRSGPSNGVGSVVGVDVHNQYQPLYTILKGKESLVKHLQDLALQAEQVILATDEDREGEAVAWHLSQLLMEHQHDDDNNNIHNNKQQRVTFTEITPSAVVHAIQHPRGLDMDLVTAQETRRILDRLAGYTLSPLLWRKIAPGLSAGRVQSVGMALIVQRERLRLQHKPVPYFSMAVDLTEEGHDDRDNANNVTATLVRVNDQPICVGTDFDNDGNRLENTKHKLHITATIAQDLRATLAAGETNTWLQYFNTDSNTTWTVTKIQSKQRSQKPPMPFTTSTLQQDAVGRLGLTVSQTMSTAQRLYEAGLISYMRTDSNQLSNDAQNAIVDAIKQTHDAKMIEPVIRKPKKTKNAQEAHEAIRPAIQPDGTFLTPSETDGLPEAEAKLYNLIFSRTIASRMIKQILSSTSMEIEAAHGDDTKLVFRVTGSIVIEPGFTSAYGKSTEDVILPPWKEGQRVQCRDLESIGRMTQPPPRYSEASFVKELEALGVGRPSTYAGTVQILRERAYVGTPVRGDNVVSKNRRKARSGGAVVAERAAGGQDFTGGGQGAMVPSLSAFVVCSLLEKHCPTYVEPSFTATMEDRLDQIARGEKGAERVAYLDEFYAGENGLAERARIIDETVDPDEARQAHLPSLNGAETGIALKVGPWGPYIQNTSDTSKKPLTAQLPAGMASDLSTITPQTLAILLETRSNDGVTMGQHPDDGRDIRLKIGRYGAFLEWGASGEEDTTRHTLPKHLRNLDIDFTNIEHSSLNSMMDLTLEEAIKYVGLPREVCTLENLPIVAAIGPYGPYLKFNNSYVSLNKADGDVLSIEEEAAVRVVQNGIINKKAGGLSRGVLAELGEVEGGKVCVKEGRFGTYLNWKRVNAKLPAEYADKPSEIPLEEAWALISEKAQKSPSKTGKKRKGSDAADDLTALNLPVGPKRPKSAYLIFCGDKRKEVQETANSLGEVSKELARLWSEIKDDADVCKYYDGLAAQEKESYLLKKKAWQEECQVILDKANIKSPKSLKKRAKAPANQPKRNKSGYLYFCAAKREEVSKSVKTLGDISKELARMWGETEGTPERDIYNEMAAADKVRYVEEMKTFKLDDGGGTTAKSSGKTKGTATASAVKKKKKVSATTATKSKLSKSKSKATAATSSKTSKTKKSASTSTSKPKKRGRSAYMIFCSDHRSTILDDDGNKLPLGETTKRLALKWKACDEETRAKYQKAAEEEKKKLLL